MDPITDDQQGTFLTKEGLEKLKEELKELKTVKRKEIAERIQQAKELGDLSENAEYHDAKTEQGFMEGRILEIEALLRNATVIDKHVNNGVVVVGSKITATAGKHKVSYELVGSNESDPSQGRISNESPIGRAFLGHKVGDKVEISTPSGSVTYTIESIG